jgi:hypothetical protein
MDWKDQDGIVTAYLALVAWFRRFSRSIAFLFVLDLKMSFGYDSEEAILFGCYSPSNTILDFETSGLQRIPSLEYLSSRSWSS